MSTGRPILAYSIRPARGGNSQRFVIASIVMAAFSVALYFTAQFFGMWDGLAVFLVPLLGILGTAFSANALVKRTRLMGISLISLGANVTMIVLFSRAFLSLMGTCP